MTTLIGPRNLPRVSWDDEGQLTTYPGSFCNADGCGVQLTSRNRAGKRLLCLEHDRERQRLLKAEAARQPKGPAKARKPAAASPQKLALRHAFENWLNHPYNPDLYRILTDGMRDFELIGRLQRIIPAPPAPAPEAPPAVLTDAPCSLH